MNIFVGNLDYQIKETELKDVFSEFGEVKTVKIITDRVTGRGKGYGFVEMANAQDGSSAIEQLDGRSINNRNINVKEANPNPKRRDY